MVGSKGLAATLESRGVTGSPEDLSQAYPGAPRDLHQVGQARAGVANRHLNAALPELLRQPAIGRAQIERMHELAFHEVKPVEQSIDNRVANKAMLGETQCGAIAAQTAQMAVENDVDVVGASSLAAGHRTLIPEMIEALKDMGRADIKVVAGGVIPPQDYAALRAAGVQAIFGPGTNLADAADEVLRLLGHNRPPLDEAAE